MISIGTLLKVHRIFRGWTQKKLADELEITQNYWCLIENGYKQPSLALLKRTTEVLNCTLTLFIDRGTIHSLDYWEELAQDLLGEEQRNHD